MDLIIDAFVYTVSAVIVLMGSMFCYGLLTGFYKYYVKKDPIPSKREFTIKSLSKEELKFLQDLFLQKDPEAVSLVSKLSKDDQKYLVESIESDQGNWIHLHVDKIGSNLYFYDGDERTGKFLFQCNTYDEMVENLNKIRGHRGVKISAELVKKLDMTDFFIKSDTREIEDESI